MAAAVVALLLDRLEVPAVGLTCGRVLGKAVTAVILLSIAIETPISMWVPGGGAVTAAATVLLLLGTQMARPATFI